MKIEDYFEHAEYDVRSLQSCYEKFCADNKDISMKKRKVLNEPVFRQTGFTKRRQTQINYQNNYLPGFRHTSGRAYTYFKNTRPTTQEQMKHRINPHIVGCGGIASQLLPCLLKVFDVGNLTLQDKDVLEQRNLDRQMFSEDQIGHNKAEALRAYVSKSIYKRANALKALVIEDWFTDMSPVARETDILISCADNHAARFAVISKAKYCKIPAIISGNEYFDSNTLLFLPETHEHDEISPLQKYPEIATKKWTQPG